MAAKKNRAPTLGVPRAHAIARSVASGLSSDTAAGRMARWLLPLGVGVQGLLGWVALQSIRRGGGEAAYVEAISTVLSIALLVCFVAWTAIVSSRWDQRRREEEALRLQSEERLHMAAEAARIGLWSWDLASGRLDWTPTCYDLLGVEPDVQMSRAAYFGLVHPDDRARVAAEATRCIVSGAFYHLEYRIVRRGEVRWVASLGRPLRDERGQPWRMMGVVLDVTDRVEEARRTEARLATERAARGEMERAARLKDEFLATVSHELRTPLNAILGWASLLQRRPDAAPLSRELAVIERNAAALVRIVEDLLDMSRVLAGKLRLALEPIPLGKLVETAVETVRATADTKGVALAKRIERDPVVMGDPARLQQVLWNLLANALKVTPKGGQVDVSLREEGACAAIEVKDTGRGIDAAFLPHVFERFRQEDASLKRQHGGLGLGLSLVKELAELHGGSVRAESEGPGAGATFTLRLPVAVTESDRTRAQAAGATLPETDAEALRGMKVLVVEDDEDARAIVTRILADHAAEVMSAASASEALEALWTATPDVLVSDIGMPDVDGYELIRRVRALPPKGSASVPAIALTAFARTEDRDRALSAGYQAHLAKPVEPWRLVAVVAALCGGGAKDSEQPRSGGSS